ncbi:SPRY-domain-containing protein, partial [Ramicandelaber brevisporus]
PMAFSSTDCSSHLEISNNGLTVSYVGRGRGDTDAASVRATKPISPYCGTFYYEVTIRSKGRSGFIGIGLSSNQFSLTRLPGWDAYSWGYHGDDGHCFGGQGTGHPFGPIYSQGDVAGCGINWSDGSIFFTKNGIHLGTPFKGIKIGTNELIVPNLYPTIGMRSPEEKVDVNFGKSPFKYDIVSHIQTEKALTWRSILKSPLTLHTEHSAASASAPLVLSYLIHAGHQRTAASLVQNLVTLSNPAITPDAPSLPTEVDESIERMNNVMLRRKSIRQSILIGDIDTAVNDAKQHFPSVFQRHADLYLRLRCRTVIELVCQVTNMVDPGQTLHELVTTNATATATAAAAVNILAGDDDGDDDSDIDTDQNEQPSPLATNGSTSNGADINAEYSDNHNPQVADTLRSTFAIFAYPNPMQSPISHNLDPSEREPLANELDEAILESLGMPSVAPLKMVAKQAIVATGELVRHG